jgi:predicted alpha/beta superfamily hydrolase
MVHAGLSDELHPTPPVPRAVGSLLHFTEIRSRFLPHPHDVIVCLPPDYALNSDRRYPVLYLHDGQNVFESGPFGTWSADIAAAAQVRQGARPGLL